MLLKIFSYVVRSTPEILTLAVRDSSSRISIRASCSYEESCPLDRSNETETEPTRDRDNNSDWALNHCLNDSFEKKVRHQRVILLLRVFMTI